MQDLVIINGQEVQRIEYKGKPVVTLAMIDKVHERPEGTARNAFNRYKDKLVEGEDYFRVPYEEWNQILVVHNMYDQDLDGEGQNGSTHGGHRRDMTFLSSSGYLMIVKPFNDDLAWKVQRQLVTRYFEKLDKSANKTKDFLLAVTKMCAPADKVLNGKASLRALHYFTGMPVDDLIKELELTTRKKRAPKVLDELTMIDFYLHALLEEGPEKYGIQTSTDSRGNRSFVALTAQLTEAFAALGKERDLPDFPLNTMQLAGRMSQIREELAKLGWIRSEDFVKRVKGHRYYSYTFINPEATDDGN